MLPYRPMLNTKYGLHKRRNWAAKMYSGLPHAAMPRKVATKVKLIKKRMPSGDVISIVGMAGVDKTTFAKVIYETSEQKFENRAWTFVPSKYRMKELLLGLLENLISVGEETLKLDTVKLAEKLRKLELDKRYLVVIDGVEKAQPWQDFEKNKVFHDHQDGSRVLLTTRSNGVALLASSSPIRTHDLQSLGGKKRSELPEKLVFEDGSCQEHLVRFGTQITAKCDELPLAIVSLAEVLAKGNNEASAEQIVERYLDELIDLCLIEVTRKRSDRVLKHSKSINFGATSGITKSERTRFLDVQMKKQKVINCAVFPIAGTFLTRLVKVTLERTDLVADDVMKTLEKLGHL
ncbi:hypothetical protein PVK06_013481 [Gossypium arboreum]|uniref:NB-ARC domain-containing protein n=1 Tax=Gossypium arboreum TaxID=29729 RepID=A0ABR0PSN3_GOSAR|nr:hypothetical protein PVK06_013481 [Gossypium arboreum]